MAQNAPESPSEADDDEFLPGYPDVVSFTQSCFRKLIKATQQAHGLPNPGDDFEFYSSFPDFTDFCKSQGSRVLSNIARVMKFQHVQCGWPSGLEESSLETDDLFESLVEANDTLLEQIDSCLDEAVGLKKNKKPVLPASMQQGNPVVSSWNKSSRPRGQWEDDKLRFLHAQNILRPQLKFKEKPDNSNVPFIPIIKEKPNSLKPLEVYRTCEMDASGDPDVPVALANFIRQQRFHEHGTGSQLSTAHPYQYELEEFQPRGEDLNLKEEQTYRSFEENDFVFVDSVEKLSKLVDVLKGVKEFAVDLEHHSFRSFLGFVCLMQISTRSKDYLIDTLELRGELAVLNEVFTDQSILKVLHGADMDIGWLQRDFGIYVVNMFDTGQATRVLEYPRFSLAFLLKKFCDVTANKQYQLADWRLRPLPSEMVRYAREDTHYLLYIHDRLRNELISKGNAQKNLVLSVYQRSKDICSKTYEKPIFTSESHLTLYHRNRKSLNRNQLEAFRLLYAWRDAIARLEDESYAYVLPNHMLFGIAEVLPKASEGVLACCNPVPSLVRQNINEIHRLVVQARDLDVTKLNGATTIRRDAMISRRASASAVDVSIGGGATANDVKVQGDVDLNVKREPMTPFRNYGITGPPVNVGQPTIGLFVCRARHTEEPTEGQRTANVIQESFKNPFQAFLPARKPEETVQETTKSNEEINRQWRTKSEETRREKGDGEVAAKDDDDATTTKRRRGGGGTERDDDDVVDDDEENVTLRQPKKNKKKKKENRNSEKNAAEEDTTAAEGDTTAAEGHGKFVPFDYSASRAALDFAGKSEAERGKEDGVFDPYKKLTQKAKRFGSKVHMKSGERSMTFGKKK